MSMLRDELITLIERMDDAQQNRLLEAAREIIEQPERLTARELMRLPHAKRDRLLRQMFVRAAAESFENFEAYSEEAIDDEQY